MGDRLRHPGRRSFAPDEPAQITTNQPRRPPALAPPPSCKTQRTHLLSLFKSALLLPEDSCLLQTTRLRNHRAVMQAVTLRWVTK